MPTPRSPTLSVRERALRLAGINPWGAAATQFEVHHVVEKGRCTAAIARVHLAALRIDLDADLNLLVLPRPHQRIHTRAYTQAVNELMTVARPLGYTATVAALQHIKTTLIAKGSFP